MKQGKKMPLADGLTADMGSILKPPIDSVHDIAKTAASQPTEIIERACDLGFDGIYNAYWEEWEDSEPSRSIRDFWQAAVAHGVDLDTLKLWDRAMGGAIMTSTSVNSFWHNSQRFAPECFERQARGQVVMRPSAWHAQLLGGWVSHCPASLPVMILKRPISVLLEEIRPDDPFPVEGEIYIGEMYDHWAIFSGKRLLDSGINVRVFIGESWVCCIYTPDEPVFKGVNAVTYDSCTSPTPMLCARLSRVRPTHAYQMALAYEYFQRAEAGQDYRDPRMPWIGGDHRRDADFPFSFKLVSPQYVHSYQPFHTYNRVGLFGKNETLQANDDPAAQSRIALLRMGRAGEFTIREAHHKLRRQYDKETVAVSLAALVDAGELNQSTRQGKRGPKTTVYTMAS